MAETCYYIDGYNLLHHSRDLKQIAGRDYESARDALIDMLARYSGMTGTQVKVVFDGRGRAAESVASVPGAPGLEVIFSPKQHSADTVIERSVYQANDRRAIVVVTGDRAISDLCRGLGAVVIGPDHFLASVREASEQVSTSLETTGRSQGIGRVEGRLSESDLDHLRDLRERLND